MTSASRPRIAAAQAQNDGVFAAQDWALFVGVSVIWGASFLLIAEALESLAPGTITLGRVGLGAATLWLIRPSGGTARIAPADRGRVVVLSLLWVAIPFTLFPLAQEHINSAVTGLLNGATPVFAGLVSALLVKVAPSPLQRIGLAVGFVGIVLISLGSAGGGTTELRGVLMALAATVCYGFAINLAAPLQAAYGAIVTMRSVLALATVWVLPYGLWSLGASSFALRPVLAVVVLGAIGTGVAYWVMASLVGRVGAVRASFITYLIPAVSLALGVTIRGDTVETVAIIGAVLTIGGAFIASRRSR